MTLCVAKVLISACIGGGKGSGGRWEKCDGVGGGWSIKDKLL